MTSSAQLLAFKLAPPAQGGSGDSLLSCDEEIERRYEVVPSVVCSMCCLFGIIYCFFGRWHCRLCGQDGCVVLFILTQTTKFFFIFFLSQSPFIFSFAWKDKVIVCIEGNTHTHTLHSMVVDVSPHCTKLFTLKLGSFNNPLDLITMTASACSCPLHKLYQFR